MISMVKKNEAAVSLGKELINTVVSQTSGQFAKTASVVGAILIFLLVLPSVMGAPSVNGVTMVEEDVIVSSSGYQLNLVLPDDANFTVSIEDELTLVYGVFGYNTTYVNQTGNNTYPLNMNVTYVTQVTLHVTDSDGNMSSMVLERPEDVTPVGPISADDDYPVDFPYGVQVEKFENVWSELEDMLITTYMISFPCKANVTYDFEMTFKSVDLELVTTHTTFNEDNDSIYIMNFQPRFWDNVTVLVTSDEDGAVWESTYFFNLTICEEWVNEPIPLTSWSLPVVGPFWVAYVAGGAVFMVALFWYAGERVGDIRTRLKNA